MARLNTAKRELDVKLVYYGPALSGKTTNLLALHRRLDPANKSRLLSINTRQDRTLFFDLLPLTWGQVRGFNIRLKVYTVPGQVHYAATRKLVLSGADGVVQVLDSAPGRLPDNLQSSMDLLANLREHGIDPEAIALVLQWNKRDLKEAASIPSLREGLPFRDCKEFESVATQGLGVLETFARAVQETIERLSRRLGVAALKDAASVLARRVLAASGGGEETPIVLHPEAREEAEGAASTAKMLRSAVSSAMKTAEEAGSREGEKRQAEEQREMLRLLVSLSETIFKDPMREGMQAVLTSAKKACGAEAAVVTLLDKAGRPVRGARLGIRSDPLLSIRDRIHPSLLARLVAASKSFHSDDLESEVAFAPVTDGIRTFLSGIVVPFRLAGGGGGMIATYSATEESPVRATALDFMRLLADQFAKALTKGLLEAQVRKSRRDWIETVDALDDLIYVVDKDYRIMRANRAFSSAVGLETGSLIGRTCHQLLFRRKTPCPRCFLCKGSDRAIQLNGYLPDRIHEARVRDLPGPSGTRLVALTDITERKDLVRHLMESEKLAAIGRLAGGMAHEINNPMACVGGNLEYLETVLAHDTISRSNRLEAGEAIKESLRGVKRVKRIVAELKRYAQGDEGEKTMFDLKVAVRSSIQIAREESGRRDIKIKFVGRFARKILGYPLKLGMALRAVVKNALEASGPGGVVEVQARVLRSVAVVEVRDQGHGIPEEVLPHLFEPFYTTKRPGPHTGLSLSVAYALVKGMEGAIDVKSKLGLGTVVRLSLPVESSVADDEPESLAAAISPIQIGRVVAVA